MGKTDTQITLDTLRGANEGLPFETINGMVFELFKRLGDQYSIEKASEYLLDLSAAALTVKQELEDARIQEDLGVTVEEYRQIRNIKNTPWSEWPSGLASYIGENNKGELLPLIRDWLRANPDQKPRS